MIGAGNDPGWRKGAIAVVKRDGNHHTLLHHKFIGTKTKWSDAESEAVIFKLIAEPLRVYHVQHFVIEDQSGMSTFARMQSQRAATARARGLKVPQGAGFNASNDSVLESVGIAKGAALAYGVPYSMEQPQSIKRGVLGVGGGKGEKSQMIEAVRVLFPELRDKKITDHEADAIAAAVIACRLGMLKLGVRA